MKLIHFDKIGAGLGIYPNDYPYVSNVWNNSHHSVNTYKKWTPRNTSRAVISGDMCGSAWLWLYSHHIANSFWKRYSETLEIQNFVYDKPI